MHITVTIFNFFVCNTKKLHRFNCIWQYSFFFVIKHHLVRKSTQKIALRMCLLETGFLSFQVGVQSNWNIHYSRSDFVQSNEKFCHLQQNECEIRRYIQSEMNMILILSENTRIYTNEHQHMNRIFFNNSYHKECEHQFVYIFYFG